MESNTTGQAHETVVESAEGGDRFQMVVAVLMAVVTVAGAIVAWRAALIDSQAGDADFAGLRANLKAIETEIVNTNSLYENYRAFVDFSHNRRLEELLDEALEGGEGAGQPDLERQRDVARQLASDHEFFFSKRYLNRDGSYNSQRDLGEARAEAAERADLNPAPHFARADALRTKANFLIGVFIVQAFALLFYTIAEGLHPARNFLRYTMALGGTVFLLASLAAAALVEWS